MKTIFKNTIVILSFAVATTASAQTESPKSTDIYVEFGVGADHSSFNSTVADFKLGLNYVRKSKYVITLGSSNVGGTTTEPDALSSSSTIYLSVGERIRLGERHWYFTPSIGVGIQNVKYTNAAYNQPTWDAQYGPNASANTYNTSVDAFGFGFLAVPKEYETKTSQNIAVPVNFNLLHAGRFFGFSFNAFFIASSNPLMGINVCLNLGKLRNKDN